MNPKAQNAKFLQNMVNSASPEQLIIILYDGAVQWLKMAKQEIKNNTKDGVIPNWSDFSHQTKMATSILDHLQDSLDMSVMEEFGDKLYALYDYLKNLTVQASAKKDAEKLDQVIDFLQDLRKQWAEAIKSTSKKAKKNSVA